MPSQKVALFLPSLEGGGAERVFVQLANRFAALGLQVDLVLAAVRGEYLEELHPDVNLVDLGSPGVLRSFPKLARYVRGSRPEVLLSGLNHANIVATLACFVALSETRGVVSVRSVTTAVYQRDRSVRHWLMLQLSKIVYRYADVVIANSRAVASDLVGSLKVSEGKLRVIYNPLDIDRIDRLRSAGSSHPWLAREARPFVVAVGSLTPLKDFATLINAFSIVRSVRDCRLAILGEGPDRRDLQLLVDKLGLQRDVALVGFVNNPFKWMSNAAVFVSSSLTEGCPNALMQALACGTPVVSTDCVGGSAEVLQGGKWGTLVPVADAKAMSEAILTTLDSTSHPNGRSRANDFELGKIAEEYLSVLLPVVSPSAKGVSS